MIVLGLDTATPATVLGLRLADGTVLQARDDPSPGERPGHSTRLLPFAHQLLAEAGLGWDRLERIAIGVGPGTFTGLRIGIATARALAQSLDTELVGISSLRALAHGADQAGNVPHRVGPDGAGPDGAGGDGAGPGGAGPGGAGPGGAEPGRVLAAIDARRGEVFVAGYEGEQERLTARAVSPDRVSELLEGALIDTTAEEWIVVGDGALLYRDSFERLGIRVPTNSSDCHRIQASSICALAVEAPKSGSGQAIVPDYLRRPDAEISLEGVA